MAERNIYVKKIFNQYFRNKVFESSYLSKNKNVSYKTFVDSNIYIHKTVHINSNVDDIWIFGYGSLLWKADFPYIDRRLGFVCGYQRRFYQHSVDHRGISSKPGRVVTLLPTGSVNDRVYGVAYRIAAKIKHDVLKHLDYREKNGYERCTLNFHQFPKTINIEFQITMYIATKENDSFAGHIWQLPLIADQIFSSAGSSGPNREYLFNLANAMRELFPGVKDDHLFELEREVYQRIQNEAKLLERALKKQIATIIENHIHIPLKSCNELIEIKELIKYCELSGWKEGLLTNEKIIS